MLILLYIFYFRKNIRTFFKQLHNTCAACFSWLRFTALI